MKNLFRKITILLIVVCAPFLMFAQQVPDKEYMPPIPNPAYENAKGPIVFIDEGHHNFHTKDGRYFAFAQLLERDGYQVKTYTGAFQTDKLEQGKILVISNALHPQNVGDWVLPNPSAFSPEEIETVRQWVESGGNLFLIADHMPMAGAAHDLAEAFDFEFTNGFVLDTLNNGPSFFSIEENTLHPSLLTRGRDSSENIHRIASFTGQGFKAPQDAHTIMSFPPHHINLLPDTAWVFNENTKRLLVDDYVQGAFMSYGKGRIVVFGEAAMFSAQLAGPNRMKAGMNNAIASENYQLLLNIIHWLDGILKE